MVQCRVLVTVRSEEDASPMDTTDPCMANERSLGMVVLQRRFITFSPNTLDLGRLAWLWSSIKPLVRLGM